MSTRPLVVEAEPAFRTQHANPYNARLYRVMQSKGVSVRDLSYLRLAVRHVDIVHLHWPDLTFLSGHRSWRITARLVLFFGFLRIARLRGTRLIWTVHNVAGHEQRAGERLRRWYRRLLVDNVDGIIGLTEDGVRAARRAYPELAAVPGFVTPHGHYRDDYELGASAGEAREDLGVAADTRLVVSVGQLRPYKNVPHLVRVFRAAALPRAVLAIAGKPSTGELRAEIVAAAGGDDAVRLDLAFQPNDTMALWLRAADLVVLPYTAIQNSGSAILALSADRPVLVPAIGAMSELAELIGDDWVRTYEGELDARQLADAVRWATAPGRPRTPDLSPLDWDRIVDATIDAYEIVLDSPRHRHGRAASAPPAVREPVKS